MRNVEQKQEIIFYFFKGFTVLYSMLVVVLKSLMYCARISGESVNFSISVKDRCLTWLEFLVQHIGNLYTLLLYLFILICTILVYSYEQRTNEHLSHQYFLPPLVPVQCDSVLISKAAHSFVTSVYRKATFTGQYIRWDSFGPKQRKTNLIDTLTHRALKICSKSTLKQELEKIRIILIDNGYPVSIVDSFITNKILKFQRKPKEGPKKCPVYVKLPWIGQPSFKTKRKLKLAIQNCFGAVQPRVIFRTKAILPTIHKDALPTFQKSLLVYQYVCRCGSRYVGRTSQRLQDRINQHVPKIIRNKLNQQRFQPNRQKKASISTPYCDSAIGNHLLENQNCAALYNQNQFSIISTARSDFHLAVLESIHITLSQPNLCRQKEFVYSLKLKLWILIFLFLVTKLSTILLKLHLSPVAPFFLRWRND